MGAQGQQGEGHTRPGGPQDTALADGPLQEQQHQRQPGQPDGDVMARAEQVQHPFPREHAAHGRHETACRFQALAARVSVHAPAGDDDMEHDQPAQRTTDRLLGECEEEEVGRVESRHLNVVDERTAAKAVGTPQRQLARLLPGAHQEALGRHVLRQQVGVIGIKDLRGVRCKIGEEEQPQRGKGQGREQAGWHGAGPRC